MMKETDAGGMLGFQASLLLESTTSTQQQLLV